MSFLVQLFLERPLWLASLAFLLFALVLFTRTRFESAGARRYSLPGVFLSIVLLFVLQKVVVTEREQILAACDGFVGAIERRDLESAIRHIGENYDAEEMTRDDFAAFLASVLENLSIRDSRFQRRDIEIDGDSARMFLGARATVSIRGGVGQLHWGVWRIDWQRELGRWRIVAVWPEMIDGHPITTLRRLRGYGP